MHMAKENLDYQINADLDFSSCINQLLFKKVLASDLQNIKKNAFDLSPKNKISIDPMALTQFKMSFYKKTMIVLLCAYLLICYTLKVFSIKKYNENKKLTLIFSLTKEQIYRKGKLDPLYEFFNANRFGINKKNRIWIENRSINLRRKHKNLYVVFDITLNLYSRQFNFGKRTKILLTIYANLFKSLKARGKYDAIYLVLKEYIFDNAVLMQISSQKIEKVITTQSHLFYQPLIFEIEVVEKKRFMLWYSSNSIPLEYKDSKAPRHEAPKIIYKYMKIDQHWVWTKEHSNYLKKTMKVNSCVKGSMLFYTPSALVPTEQKIDVLIFDVTPSSDHNINKNSIHNSEHSRDFLTEIINICIHLEKKYRLSLNICLKPKRQYSYLHDYSYINFLDNLKFAGKLRILKPDENLYDIINLSKIIIGYPFVSPVIIGKNLNLPSYFYSSSKLLKLAPKNYTGFFIQSPKKLQLELEKLLVS